VQELLEASVAGEIHCVHKELVAPLQLLQEAWQAAHNFSLGFGKNPAAHWHTPGEEDSTALVAQVRQEAFEAAEQVRQESLQAAQAPEEDLKALDRH